MTSLSEVAALEGTTTETVEPERWRPVVGFEDAYEVSSLGRVRSLDRQCAKRWRPGRLLRPWADKHGYHMVELREHTRRVARVVLEAFVGSCPPGMEACHFPDRSPANNRLANLRWDTKSGNQHDRVAHGTSNRGERNGVSRLTDARVREIFALYRAGSTKAEIARRQQLAFSTVRRVLAREGWTHVEIRGAA